MNDIVRIQLTQTFVRYGIIRIRLMHEFALVWKIFPLFL